VSLEKHSREAALGDCGLGTADRGLTRGSLRPSLVVAIFALGGARASAGAEPAPPIINSIGMTLVAIPAGEFEMGSGEEDPAAGIDERPRRRVRITRPFYLGAHEVTQAQYRAVMGADSSWFSPTGPGRGRVAGHDTAAWPADMVSWTDAAEFCRRLSELPAERLAGRSYRLPFEAEWEYACRAGTDTAFSTGSILTRSRANVNDRRLSLDGLTDGLPRPVGAYQPNAFGLYDMHGNVWEWCQDWYAPDYYAASPSQDPPAPAAGTGRVVRGGDWFHAPSYSRSANRDFTRATRRDLGNGFRVACSLER
jgi:formylglycine-generating enzyme required for sulfatase activity